MNLRFFFSMRSLFCLGLAALLQSCASPSLTHCAVGRYIECVEFDEAALMKQMEIDEVIRREQNAWNALENENALNEEKSPRDWNCLNDWTSLNAKNARNTNDALNTREAVKEEQQ